MLRDGKFVGTYATADAADALIEKMVGRKLLNDLFQRTSSNGAELLVEKLTRK